MTEITVLGTRMNGGWFAIAYDIHVRYGVVVHIQFLSGGNLVLYSHNFGTVRSSGGKSVNLL